jgi:hypothetical protein
VRPPAVVPVAVVLYEPNVGSMTREDDLALMSAASEQGAAGSCRRPTPRWIARVFHRYICTDDEIAAALETDYLERCASILPLVQQVFLRGQRCWRHPWRCTRTRTAGRRVARRSIGRDHHE